MYQSGYLLSQVTHTDDIFTHRTQIKQYNSFYEIIAPQDAWMSDLDPNLARLAPNGTFKDKY